jgi:hypothetical protein
MVSGGPGSPPVTRKNQPVPFLLGGDEDAWWEKLEEELAGRGVVSLLASMSSLGVVLVLFLRTPHLLTEPMRERSGPLVGGDSGMTGGSEVVGGSGLMDVSRSGVRGGERGEDGRG